MNCRPYCRQFKTNAYVVGYKIMVMGGWKVIYFLIEHTDYSIYIMKGSSAGLSIEQKYDVVMTVNTLFLTAEWQKISAPKVFYCFRSNKSCLNVTDKWMAQRYLSVGTKLLSAWLFTSQKLIIFMRANVRCSQLQWKGRY